MGDGFWNRPPAPSYASAAAIKRPRPDFDTHPPGDPSSYGMVHYPPQNTAYLGLHVVKDTKTIGDSYDRYLQTVMPSFATGVASNLTGAGFVMGVGEMPGTRGGMLRPNTEPVMIGAPGTVAPGPITDGQGISFDGQIHVDPMSRPRPQGPAIHLPPDASSTLFVEGLPRDCTEREVAHIFRPFVGFKEVRLVIKEPKYHSGSSLLLCFVDFIDAACAMTALIALEGYKMDAHDPDSPALRVQFARKPGPRSGPGSRGNR
uniref:Protein WHI3 n=1 Tax=Anthurium amnicola TaxID=1678845 RepID=A0A1D1Y0X0_9ARAE